MPHNLPPPELAKSWKIGILHDEIDGLNSAFEIPQSFDPGEKELLIEMRDRIQQWVGELHGLSKPKSTRDDIDWRFHILDNVINNYSLILEEDESLDDSDCSEIEEDIKRLKQWKAELRLQKKVLQ